MKIHHTAFHILLITIMIGALSFATQEAHARGKAGLSPPQIQKVFGTYKSNIKQCAARENAKKLEGRMMLSFKISPEGKVQGAKIAKMSRKFVGTDVGRCVLRVVSGMSFPRASKATPVSLFPVEIKR